MTKSTKANAMAMEDWMFRCECEVECEATEGWEQLSNQCYHSVIIAFRFHGFSASTFWSVTANKASIYGDNIGFVGRSWPSHH